MTFLYNYRKVWWVLPNGIWRRIVWWKVPIFLEEPVVSKMHRNLYQTTWRYTAVYIMYPSCYNPTAPILAAKGHSVETGLMSNQSRFRMATQRWGYNRNGTTVLVSHGPGDTKCSWLQLRPVLRQHSRNTENTPSTCHGQRQQTSVHVTKNTSRTDRMKN
jgi:hypothetical protein